MLGLTHYAARDLLNAGSAELSAAERNALTTHLEQCVECQTYATELSELRTALTHLFRQRWQPVPSQQMIDTALVCVRKRQAWQPTARRIKDLVFAVGLVAVMLALAWVLNRSAAPSVQQAASVPAATNNGSPVPPPQTTSSAPKYAPGSQIHLISHYGAEERLWPGSSFTLTLRWQTSAPITTSYQSFVHVLDDQGNLVASSDGIPGGRETTTWAIGETIDDVQTLSLPDNVKPGPYSIVAGLYDRQSGMRVRLEGQDSVRLMTISVQALQHSIYQDFGGFARLLGADGITNSVFAGEAVPITLYWRSLAATTSSYRVSLQVFDANKGLVAQTDGIPGNGARPTNTWQPDVIIVDPHTLQLPPELAPGEYRLLLLMFDASNGTRVFTGDGNGAITLATFNVQAKPATSLSNPIDLPARHGSHTVP